MSTQRQAHHECPSALASADEEAISNRPPDSDWCALEMGYDGRCDCKKCERSRTEAWDRAEDLAIERERSK